MTFHKAIRKNAHPNLHGVYLLYNKGRSYALSPIIILLYIGNYISKHTILRNIQGELNHHLTSNHQGILETFDPDAFSYDNEDHEDFLLFFVNAYWF